MKNDRVVKFTNEGNSPTYLGLTASLPGKVIPVSLAQSGTLLAKPSVFLCRCESGSHLVIMSLSNHLRKWHECC